MAAYGQRSGRATKKKRKISGKSRAEPKKKKASPKAVKKGAKKASSKSEAKKKRAKLRAEAGKKAKPKNRAKVAARRKAAPARKRVKKRATRARAKAAAPKRSSKKKAVAKTRARARAKAIVKTLSKKRGKKATKKKGTKKPAAKKPAAKKAAAKKPVAKKPAAKKPAAKPVAKKTKKAAPKKKVRKRSLQERYDAAQAKNRKQAKQIAELVKAQKRERAKGTRTFKAKLKRQLVKKRWRAAVDAAPAAGLAPTTDAVATDLRRRFQLLFEHAQRTGQFPRTGRLRTVMSSELNVGVQRKVTLRRLLRRENDLRFIHDKVDQAARTLSTRYPIWNGFLAISALGQGLPGYGHKKLDVTGMGPESGHTPEDIAAGQFFEVAAFHGIGISSTRTELMERLDALLGDLLATPHTQVYVHYAVVRTYRPRRNGS